MTSLVEKYSGKCIYRELLDDDLNSIVVSLSYHRDPQETGGYLINVEFEPLSMVGQGEGWIWWSTAMSENELLKFIKEFVGQELDEINSLPDYEKYFYDENVISSEEDKQSLLIEKKYIGGYSLLPRLPDKTIWKIAPDIYKTK